MQTLTMDQVDMVSGAVKESTVLAIGGGILGAGAAILGGAALVLAAPELAVAGAVYGIVAGVSELASVAEWLTGN